MKLTISQIAEFVGIIGILFSLICFHGKNMKNVLKIKLCIDITWGIHYLLLGAFSGFATNLICLFREIVFINQKKRSAPSKAWPIFFVVLNFIGAICTWKSIYSLIPAFVSMLATYSFWQNNVHRARIIAILNNLLMFTYDVCVLSHSGMVNETLAFISNIIALIVGYLTIKKERTVTE